jgi:hypothetical protein
LRKVERSPQTFAQLLSDRQDGGFMAVIDNLVKSLISNDQQLIAVDNVLDHPQVEQ